MNYDEIEFKYDAKNISLQSFHELCRNLNPLQEIRQHGKDTFYSHEFDNTKFCRHRRGNDINQLTYKKKTCLENSIIRKEINVELNIKESEETISEFLHNNGYTKGNTIEKVSLVYLYEDYVMAYYICYDLNMNELGRFLEIEVREDKDLGDIKTKLGWLSIIERQVKPLNISPKDRINLSLYEMYGKVLTKNGK